MFRKASAAAVLSLLTLTACTTPRDFEPYMGPEGHYRLRAKDGKTDHFFPEAALRDQDGKVIRDKSKAERLHSSFNSLKAMQENIAGPGCWAESVYDAQIAQYEALQAILKKNYSSAAQKLEAAKEACPIIPRYSKQYYLEALTAQGQGDTALAKKKTEEFMAFSSTVEPAVFHTFDPGDDWGADYNSKSARETIAYRQKANEYLSGATSELSLPARTEQAPSVPRMYSNNPFRPGGSLAPYFVLQPVVTYSLLGGMGVGVGVHKSWGKHGLGVAVQQSEDIGAIYGLKARHSLYESPSRDLNVDVAVFGSSWKKAIVKTDSLSIVRSREVTSEGIDYGATLGATRRFRYPSLGVSAAVTGRQENMRERFNVVGTLYGFYDLTWAIDVFAGILQNDPVVGSTVGFGQFSYNLRQERFDIMLTGLSF